MTVNDLLPQPKRRPEDGMMHGWYFSKITIFRDVRNSAIIEKWPELNATSP